MGKEENSKPYDLEERTEAFARRVRKFLRDLKPGPLDIDDARQLIRCSGSVGANYIEANDALSKKDFLCRAKISKKESKESRYFLRLIFTEQNPALDRERLALIQEATEIMNILGAIIRNSA